MHVLRHGVCPDLYSEQVSATAFSPTSSQACHWILIIVLQSSVDCGSSVRTLTALRISKRHPLLMIVVIQPSGDVSTRKPPSQRASRQRVCPWKPKSLNRLGTQVTMFAMSVRPGCGSDSAPTKKKDSSQMLRHLRSSRC